MRRLMVVFVAVVVVTGVCVVRVGRWLLLQDLHDDTCAGGDCGHCWAATTEDAGDSVHVVPLRDHIDHPLSEDCVCGPRPEAVFRPDGSNGWLYTHHSLDGREATE
ncbi:hypothetical protein KVF89_22460 [Nocardioides carbamazepini]|uniref:hypothetical protein n=1 Tax=Nocardioides carbamazepini TaxID=2854259 RepID=UPI002149F4A8|nr:hypothetical protein [Nocardioides carbamazepini]MCR1785320.1 hypothetical protein [Nocardioides carbamazepini]